MIDERWEAVERKQAIIEKLETEGLPLMTSHCLIRNVTGDF
jgi:hypothetical protein